MEEKNSPAGAGLYRGLSHPPREKQQHFTGQLWGTAHVQVAAFFSQNGCPALWNLPSQRESWAV